MTAIIRQDDTGDHNKKKIGKVFKATGSATLNGKKIAVDGDLYLCPSHGKVKMIATGSMMVDGKKSVKVGDKTTCGAILSTGSPDGFED